MSKKQVFFEDIETISCNATEQETSVTFLRQENVMKIYTSDNTTLTDLKKKLRDNPSEWKCWEGPRNSDGTISGYFFEAPKDLLTFRTKTVSREMTEEQRQAAAERLRATRNKQKEEQ